VCPDRGAAQQDQGPRDAEGPRASAAVEVARRYPLDVTGVDVDPEQIRRAEESSQGLENVRFLTADATCLPFPDSEFDIAATNKLTHHIPDWEGALAEMIRVVKPNGYLVYADFVVPPWVASIGRTALGARTGFPTAPALELEAFLARHDLARVRVSTQNSRIGPRIQPAAKASAK
jgi:ubiquinone/menaquinone biosynthesis C-methylase UbiE